MELVKILDPPALGNAPKGLSSEFGQNRAKHWASLSTETANEPYPLVSQMPFICSVAASLASLAPLRQKFKILRLGHCV